MENNPQNDDPKTTKQMTVRVDLDTFRKFKAKVAREGRTMQTVLRHLVERYLDEPDQLIK